MDEAYGADSDKGFKAGAFMLTPKERGDFDHISCARGPSLTRLRTAHRPRLNAPGPRARRFDQIQALTDVNRLKRLEAYMQ